jgi:UDP-3-O-[3-hydroxymyristoyl] N-acetylglucosamine deacetylase
MAHQQTIRREVSCAGIGLHSGKKVRLRFVPAPTDTGIVFRRVDTGGQVRAERDNLSTINYATSLSRDGVSVATIEHLLSAAYALRVDNLYVELDAPEVPIMDGSAAPFIYLFHEAGLRRQGKPRRVLRVVKPVRVTDGDKSMAVFPSDGFKVSYTIKFAHPLIQYQTSTIPVTPPAYASYVAPARTFCFLRDVEPLRRKGLTLGGSLDNAVVLDDVSILNEKLRFSDEFVRHKILDAIGDLALIGYPLLGHVVAYKGGHALHSKLVGQLLVTPDAWKVETEGIDEEALAPAVPALDPQAASA